MGRYEKMGGGGWGGGGAGQDVEKECQRLGDNVI